MNRKHLESLAFIALVIISTSLAFVGWHKYQQPEIIIEWSSASELNIIGYHLYRSEDGTDDISRITPNLIPVGDDLHLGNEYAFADTEVSPGKVYKYWLEEIDRLGQANRSAPITIVAERDAGGLGLLILGLVLCLVSILNMLWHLRRSRTRMLSNSAENRVS